ncbi:hypothetical protein, partial [Streptomyces sp. NPDC059409]|uniref:hypothetical protein n=1 Tax=Streptomyces sp. NPDC059409 TaxID=3346824 RepID=UPI0036BF521A
RLPPGAAGDGRGEDDARRRQYRRPDAAASAMLLGGPGGGGGGGSVGTVLLGLLPVRLRLSVRRLLSLGYVPVGRPLIIVGHGRAG